MERGRWWETLKVCLCVCIERGMKMQSEREREREKDVASACRRWLPSLSPSQFTELHTLSSFPFPSLFPSPFPFFTSLYLSHFTSLSQLCSLHLNLKAYASTILERESCDLSAPCIRSEFSVRKTCAKKGCRKNQWFFYITKIWNSLTDQFWQTFLSETFLQRKKIFSKVWKNLTQFVTKFVNKSTIIMSLPERQTVLLICLQ